MTLYYLSLNKAVLLLFPSGDASSEPHVVQVIIKTSSTPTVGVLTSFFLAQSDITKIIESLVGTHLTTPVPREVVLEGRGYNIRGRRQEWKYGKGLKLAWGDQQVNTGDDKWVFFFETT
ncbi:hypothetical protein PILCRDRAFT_810969 [Piloderma croceum F 1598]|uniref:Uncharacterized protein n=1 Tax=Piloderma croceum (strain F 1598) TaxID=765440 RepID=A0A0C3CPT6_PILCF|nr:hypothetical protein PILCRDRAFT_810969 [Piloderma croceum F 1598]